MDFAALTDHEKDILEGKKARIASAISVGMSLSKAFIVSGCTIEECQYFEKDVSLQRILTFTTAKAELDILEQHKTARGIAASKGNAAPLQWMLGKLDPRWADNGTKSGLPPDNGGRDIEFDITKMTDDELRRML